MGVINEVDREKGVEAEESFKKWLNKHDIPYLYIQQDIGTFSPALKKYFGAGRPDFMILVHSLGFIMVDVKYKELTLKYKNFTLDYNALTKHLSLERNFKLPVWYVLSNKVSNYNTWYWIPVSKALERGKIISSQAGNKFVALIPEEFIQVAVYESLDKLFSEYFLRGLRKGRII